jgi:SagB-type dehydrogenase family enzyme
MSSRVQRAPHILLLWRDGALICVDGRRAQEYEISPKLVLLLDAAARPKARAELAHVSGVPIGIVDSLIEKQLLVPEELAEQSEYRLENWSSLELAVHRTTSKGRVRPHPRRTPMPSMRLQIDGTRIDLTRFLKNPPFRAFDEVLANRRSVRAFTDVALEMRELAMLLLNSAAVSHARESDGVSFRPYPSGGGRHPLEVFVLPMRVETLSRNAHYFDPFNRCLVELKDAPITGSWLAETVSADNEWLADGAPPAAVLAIGANFDRTMWKYSNLGLSLIYKDTGALLQTLYLQATAQGLGGCAVGGGPHDSAFGIPGLDRLNVGFTAAFVVGHPVAGRT